MKKLLFLSVLSSICLNAKADVYMGVDVFTNTNIDYNDVNKKLIDNEYINFGLGFRDQKAGVEVFKTFNFPHGVIASNRSNVWLNSIDKMGILFTKYWQVKTYDMEYSISFGVANITRTLSHDIKSDISESFSSNVVGFGISKDINQDMSIHSQIKLYDGYDNMSEFTIGFKFYI